MAGTALLVVDDDSVIRLSIERAARKMGLGRRVDFAVNGREALQRLQALLSDDGVGSVMVLLDINMPEMDGFEALEAIAADPTLCRAPVFMLSSSDAAPDIERAYRHGATGYLVKGAGMADVTGTLEFVDSYLENVRLRPSPAEGIREISKEF